jgi:hypothetical protein
MYCGSVSIYLIPGDDEPVEVDMVVMATVTA